MNFTTPAAFLFCLVTGAAFGSANEEAGRALYASCAACHGGQGEGVAALDAPAVAGQTAAYLIRQLEHFRDGRRGSDPDDVPGAQMRGMVAVLTDGAAIADVAAYVASLPFTTTAGAQGSFNARNGENQYNAACGACHGSAAEGNPRLNAPRLAGLDAEYLRRQYGYFASGLRGSDPDDQYGRQMQMMASMLTTKQDLEDVIGFILSQ